MGINDKMLVMRLPENLLRRAAKVGKVLSHKPEYTGLRMTQSAVLRLAIEQGLTAMENSKKK